MEELNIVYLNPRELTPYKNNARNHSPKDIDAIKESISQFGFSDPIGVWGENNLIVEGHGRCIAAIEMGLAEVPCIRLDHMDDEQRKAYSLAHNRTAELSGWNFDKLSEELAELEIAGWDIEKLGFELDQETGTSKDQDKPKPEIEFSEVLGEANNYLILQFKTDIDWLNACTVFDIKTVKCYSTRKDGVITDKMTRLGVAKVLDGAEAIKKIMGDV